MIAFLDGLEDDGRGRIQGATAGHHVDLREKPKGLHGDSDQHEHCGVAETGPGDIPELLPGIRACNGGSFV